MIDVIVNNMGLTQASCLEKESGSCLDVHRLHLLPCLGMEAHVDDEIYAPLYKMIRVNLNENAALSLSNK
jgi:hypothetical protein